mmetsp:Transcript_12799/g.21657  ORF Transcript_12799/g.21657 Transcript_12799/m.21657 type:complete len:202 (-) Transcript_12799:24-629(-)
MWKKVEGLPLKEVVSSTTSTISLGGACCFFLPFPFFLGFSSSSSFRSGNCSSVFAIVPLGTNSATATFVVAVANIPPNLLFFWFASSCRQSLLLSDGRAHVHSAELLIDGLGHHAGHVHLGAEAHGGLGVHIVLHHHLVRVILLLHIWVVTHGRTHHGVHGLLLLTITRGHAVVLLLAELLLLTVSFVKAILEVVGVELLV